jgi:hypothetical protein
MDAKVLVHCQYFENYNLDINGFGEVPHWKPKGGHTFQMPIDSDIMMYGDEGKVIQAITNLVEAQNSIAEKFEYREHELVFSEPTLVEGLGEEIQKLHSEAV